MLERDEYGKQRYQRRRPPLRPDRGITGADLGDTGNDYPDSHPLYYQNAAVVWRGLHEYTKVLQALGSSGKNAEAAGTGQRYAAIAEEMRANVQRSIEATIAASTPEMRQAGITPFRAK